VLAEVMRRLLHGDKMDISEDSDSRVYLMTLKWRIHDIEVTIRSNYEKFIIFATPVAVFLMVFLYLFLTIL
jgi:hypothetical protein